MCGVHEERSACESGGRRPHRTSSWRPETVLGQKQLAGPVPPAPQHENAARGPNTNVQIPKIGSSCILVKRSNSFSLCYTFKKNRGSIIREENGYVPGR